VERYARSLNPKAGKASVISLRKARVLAFLTRNKMLRAAAALMAYFEKVDEPGDPAVADALLGAPTTTLDEWITSRGAELVKTG